VRDAIRLAAGKKPRGQGRRLDAAERQAIELRAMAVTRLHFETEGWDIEDVSSSRSYDFHGVRGADQLRIEVKGTTGDGTLVLLTPGEVRHARENAPEMVLSVVAGIELQRWAGELSAVGGELELVTPWDIDAHGELRPTGFEYRRM
jgi:Domain of unknown function (DUF3883)